MIFVSAASDEYQSADRVTILKERKGATESAYFDPGRLVMLVNETNKDGVIILVRGETDPGRREWLHEPVK
jgi:hypothetical protein